MKRVIFFVLLTNMSILSFSQNLIVNPGFESWEKPNKPAGWTTAQNCLKDSVYIKSGKYTCRHEGGTKYLGQILLIVPGKNYTLSFFYRIDITGTGNGCRIWCYFKDANGNNLIDLATDNILRPSKYLKGDTWQQFSVEFEAPPDASSFYLEVRTYQNSIAYFDDFIFEENVATINPEEKVSDIKIYPDPARDYIIISNLSDLQHIYIQSLSGITVWSSRFSGEESVTIPLSGLPNGIYMLSIRTIDKLIIRKFIINN